MKNLSFFFLVLFILLGSLCDGQNRNGVSLAITQNDYKNDSLILTVTFKNVSTKPIAILEQGFSTFLLRFKLYLEILNQDSVKLYTGFPNDYLGPPKYIIIKPKEKYSYNIDMLLNDLVPKEFLEEKSAYQKKDSVFSLKLQYLDRLRKHKYSISDTLTSNVIKVKRHY
jgi:hypothetical protein